MKNFIYPSSLFSNDLTQKRRRSLEDLLSGNFDDELLFGLKTTNYIYPNLIIKKNFNYVKKIGTHINNQNYNIKNLQTYLNTNIQNSKSISQVSLGRTGLTTYLSDSALVTADNIAEFVFPIVEYIRATQPDCIIACDRGARLIGLATFMLYAELYGKLPTHDGTLKFRRISKSNTQQRTQEHLEPLAQELLEARDTPRVLVLDDWISSGGTKDMVNESFRNLSDGLIDVKFGVLQGSGADVSGNSGKSGGFAGTVEWHDNSRLIGVDYHGMSARIERGDEHRKYRRRIRNSVQSFVKSREKTREAA